jgi:pyruvate ferredoxin oxidoreductase delta subunit
MRPRIDLEKCKMCWLCFIYCPEGAVKKTDDGPVIDFDYCKGCGICATECKAEAIEMEMEVK